MKTTSSIVGFCLSFTLALSGCSGGSSSGTDKAQPGPVSASQSQDQGAPPIFEGAVPGTDITAEEIAGSFEGHDLPDLNFKGPVLQVLHTNDLHSHFEYSNRKDRGGLARIKALMDYLEAEGNKRGWVTIRIDAGDFSEGHIQFLANEGSFSFQLMKLMNYDAIAVGNHDFQTGLDALMARGTRPEETLPLVSANIVFPTPGYIQPGRLIERGGLKVAVAGATTDEMEYKWAIKPGDIVSPNEPVENWLMSQGRVDLRIALTHLGEQRDRDMVRATRGIDLIVGGHSHHVLQKPKYELNRKKYPIPVVQTGCRGNFLGQTLIGLPSYHGAQVLHYQLHKINAELPKDPAVLSKVKEVKLVLSHKFKANVEEVVAESDEEFASHRERVNPLTNFLTDALKVASGAEIALDYGELYGPGLPKGPVTLLDLLNLMPHVYTFANDGWHVYTGTITGKHLKTALWLGRFKKTTIGASGIEAHIKDVFGYDYLLINGEPAEDDRTYSIAFSEGLISAAKDNVVVKRLLPPPYSELPILMRDAIVKHAFEIRHFTRQSFGAPRVTWDGYERAAPHYMCGECLPPY